MRKSEILYGGYEDTLIKAIDESLAKYWEASEAFPEIAYGDWEVKGAERIIKGWMRIEPIHQGLALGQVRRWLPDLYVAYMDHFKYDSSVRARFYRMGSPGQNRRALEWLLKGLRYDLL